jgi:hypothetical protein
MLISKEQPIASSCTSCIPVCKEGAERGDACSRSDHNNILIICRQPELIIVMHIEIEFAVDVQISDGDEDYLCEYTDWRTGEVLYRGDGKDRPDPTVTEPPGHWHIDNLEFDISVTAEPVAGLPDSLVEAISYWVIENEEAARAWIQSGQGGSITVTLPAGLYD